ncbi:MAG: glycosyltransferase [Saprospiraceae bacterium]|nr:glycosyltransferase [Saprospiraceae bacterium]
MNTSDQTLPLFSVIIPTYNRGYIIAEAIDSIRAQKMTGIEIIIIDDGSTDNTKEVLDSTFPEVIYIYQENKGISNARNRGIEVSTGEYISFLDSDDVFLPDKMKRELQLFDEFKEADAIAADSALFDDHVKAELTYMERRGLVENSSPFFFGREDIRWTRGSLFPVCSMTIKRTALQKLGGIVFDPSFGSAEDWDFEIRLIRNCRLLVYPQVMSHVRRFEDGTRLERNHGLKAFNTSVYAMILHKRVLEKAQRLGRWSTEIEIRIQSRIDEYYDQIAKLSNEES